MIRIQVSKTKETTLLSGKYIRCLFDNMSQTNSFLKYATEILKFLTYYYYYSREDI